MAGGEEIKNQRRHPRKLWQNGEKKPEKGAEESAPSESENHSESDTDRQQPGGETPSWWQPHKDSEGAGPEHAHSHIYAGHQRQCVELCPICRTADLIRTTAPPELKEQWETFQNEALTVLRSLIDSYIGRMQRSEGPTNGVEDIPVE